MIETRSQRVLIVDDDPAIAALYEKVFFDFGYRVQKAESVLETKKLLKSYSFDAILLDLVLGKESGLGALPMIFEDAPYTKVFILTGHGSIQMAVDSVKKGVSGFFTKDSDPKKIVSEVIQYLEVRESKNPESEIGNLGIIGESPAIVELRHTILRLRNVDSTVLISGESGTGKELVARGLHDASVRCNERFEAINCGAIPENLLESELFGHRKGAFTDAKSDRKGIFEICTNGTLFLDEIGEMPINLQSKILRVLQEKEFTPVGGGQSIKVNTRIVAATNKNLQEEVKLGRFREDLYFRLSVIPVVVPPLRTRKEDIPWLVKHFVKRFNDRFKRQIAEPSHEIMSRLLAHSWPGNIRELQNMIERAVVMSQDQVLHLEDLFLGSNANTAEMKNVVNGGIIQDTAINSDVFELPLSQAKQAFEKAYLEHLLEVSDGNITEAAAKSGRYRADIYRLMHKYQVKPD